MKSINIEKIIASCLITLIILLHLLRYNLWILNANTNISLFDLLGNICWILVVILLILNQKSRFLISCYILLGSGALNSAYDELIGSAEVSNTSDYVFLSLGIITIITYNIITKVSENKE